MLKTKSFLATTLLVAAFQAPVFAEGEQTIAVGAKLGTLGFGLEAKTKITDNVYGRLGVNYFKYNVAKNVDNNRIKGDLRLLSVPLMVDYHPYADSGFRISAGLAYNGNEFNLSGKTTKSVTSNGRTYTPSEIGTLKTKLKLGSGLAGLATIGYDSALVQPDPLSFSFEAGIMYTSAPKFKVSASGLLGADKQMIQDLEAKVNKDLKSVKNRLRVLPVLSFGFKYSL
ncbi:MAG: hypothetical protein K0Q51_1021 [Rickettsiaceae bacterium]|jgi:hypothetical protein|nr:hypothetical protein [Rickettsiaceae bacterium]